MRILKPSNLRHRTNPGQYMHKQEMAYTTQASQDLRPKLLLV